MSLVESRQVGQTSDQTEATIEVMRARRGRIACDLLLARLFKHHPDHAMAALKGIEPHVVDLEPPPKIETPSPKVIPLPVFTEDVVNDICPSIKTIVEQVGKFYGISPLEMVSGRRRVRAVWPRQVAMFLARDMTLLSTPAIGRLMGKRDHTTVLHGANKIEDAAKIDERVADELDVLRCHIRTATLNGSVASACPSIEVADATQPAH